MNTNKKTKNVKMNKSIEYLESNNSFDTPKTNENINNTNRPKKENY